MIGRGSMGKFKKILLLDFKEETLEPKFWERIDALCEEKVLLPRDSPEIQDHLTNSDCILVNFLPTVDKERIDKMPNLRYIGTLATGFGRIDADHAATKGIPVCNIPGYSTESVAEFTFATILEHLRELERGKKQAREGNYSEASFTATEIKGKPFGVIGLGNIGHRVAEIAFKGFQADLRYWNRTRKQECENKGFKYQELKSLIEECEFISINIALTKETEKLLDESLIKAIKPGALIVNTAPMDVLDMDALVQRLSLGDITFILDHSDELSEDDAKRLSQYKNCIIYPPIAYVSKEATANKQEIFVSNLENFLKESPTNKVN